MRKVSLIFMVLFISFSSLLIFSSRFPEQDSDELAALTEKVKRLEVVMENNRRAGKRVHELVEKRRPPPIPVLVFACDRPWAVRDHLWKLVEYRRPDKRQFPIIVTQECDDERVREEVQKFGDQVEYVKHVSGRKTNVSIGSGHERFATYYMISRHYKLALDYVFNEKHFSSVIITEDDLDIAPDFFSYFSNTRHLLDVDPTLWCVSAWNDNGQPENIDRNASATLYRTDFMSGLGWMITSKTWQELGPIWPAAFWDDWMRDPERRKGRQCVRPEVSRSGMSAHGRHGASSGQFFSNHLTKVWLNEKSTDFSRVNLDYLLPNKFKQRMQRKVMEEAVEMSMQQAMHFISMPENAGKSVRVHYTGNVDFVEKAAQLGIMGDFKAGVPRTAYAGTVTCFKNGVRVFLVADRSRIFDYVPTWTVLPSLGDTL
ncbi:unnamed protein product [Caenorhabditis sp. 36 PRJEB53466]|nr:unnamed protein product [Caenorhabditis sp. 36 PRJEB53466]